MSLIRVINKCLSKNRFNCNWGETYKYILQLGTDGDDDAFDAIEFKNSET